jgi:hypothetical protein
VTDFAASTDRLLGQVRHWEQPRWSAADRADRMYALVQLLADLAADAEGRPHRQVPRAHDVLLPDQLRVMADDLLAAGPSPAVLVAAADAVRTTQAAL